LFTVLHGTLCKNALPGEFGIAFEWFLSMANSLSLVIAIPSATAVHYSKVLGDYSTCSYSSCQQQSRFMHFVSRLSFI